MFDSTGLDNLIRRIGMIANLNAAPLMATWVKHTLPDDNRNGILVRRTDGNGKPLLPVTYRPVTANPIDIRSKHAKPLRNNASGRIKRGVFGGFGAHPAGANNNLTSREYRMLDGPPTAPRGAFSRVITNYKTDFTVSADGKVWTVYGAWFEVVDKKGRSFLRRMFVKRDLVGIRPEGMAEARRTFIAWASDQIRMQPAGFFNKTG